MKGAAPAARVAPVSTACSTSPRSVAQSGSGAASSLRSSDGAASALMKSTNSSSPAAAAPASEPAAAAEPERPSARFLAAVTSVYSPGDDEPLPLSQRKRPRLASSEMSELARAADERRVSLRLYS